MLDNSLLVLIQKTKKYMKTIFHKKPRYLGKSTCSKKKSFDSKISALVGASLALRKTDNETFRAYKCPQCHKWHLTTQIRNEKI